MNHISMQSFMQHLIVVAKEPQVLVNKFVGASVDVADVEMSTF